jgi:hypothetical protein
MKNIPSNEKAMTTMTKNGGRNNQGKGNNTMTTSPARVNEAQGNKGTPRRAGRRHMDEGTVQERLVAEVAGVATVANVTGSPKLWSELLKENEGGKKQKTGEETTMEGIHDAVEEAKTEEEAKAMEQDEDKVDEVGEVQEPPIPPRLRSMPKALSDTCKFATYFDLKMPILGSGIEYVFRALGRFAAALDKADKNMRIFPYAIEDLRDRHTVTKMKRRGR